jgi:hypothetical protein
MKQPNPVNPFAVPVQTPAPEPTRWGIAASGPPVDPAEVETAQRAAEVTILWGDEVLHVAHVSPPRDVVIGEAGSGAAPDYAMGRELLGADRLAVVVERNGQLCCVIPEGATGEVRVGDARRSIADLASEGKLLPYEALAGAQLYPLPEGASARIDHRGLAFLVKPTHAARVVAGAGLSFKHTGWIGLSLAVHAVFLIMFYLMPDHSAALSNDHLRTDTRLVEYLLEAPAHVEEPPPELTVTQGEQGQPGQRHAGDEGQAGDPEEQPSRGRMAVRGNRDNPNPQLAREHARENMETIGAIGAVRALVGNWNTPTSPFGADAASGRDPESALGALFGDQIGGNFGHGGLGMRGTGRGAGGDGVGTVGLGTLGTIGNCVGERCGDGYGRAVDFGNRPRPTRVPPPVTPGVARVNGALSQEAIRRVVHRHLPEVRFCYEQGLQHNPSLEGRVSIQWIIGADGRVQSSALASSSLSNSNVESCIVGAVQRWTFPSPDGGGVVGVNYPFVLQSNH